MSLLKLLSDCVTLYLLYQISRWILARIFLKPHFHDISGPASSSWVMGNLKQLFNAKGLPFHQHLVDRYGGMVKVYGFFGDEQLYISDPHALQAILGKDQESFEETAVFTETNKVIFGPGLVATTGDHHRRQRKLVSPMFSTAQLRQVTPTFYELSEKLSGILTNEIRKKHTSDGMKKGRGVLDMSEWVSRLALEIVGQAVLGYSFDPLDTPHNNPYTSAIKELIPTLFSLSLVRQFAPFLSKLGPPWFRRKLVEWTPHRAVQKVKDMSDVMHNTACKILQEKREELHQQEQVGGEDFLGADKPKDLISLLLRANDKANQNGEKLSDTELTGQMTVMIFGAQDTTSSALSRMLHLLSTHTDVQDKLRAELREAYADPEKRDSYHPRRLRYDAVMGLSWLDAVIKETLRLYPPVPFVRRTCIKETTVPYCNPNACHECDSGPSPFRSSVTIPKGTTVFLGIAGSNRLESVWGPDAKEWKPERWMTNTSSGGSNVRLPGVFAGMMSFLGGGRSCIGYKFAIIEMKIVLATLLSRMRFSATEDEIVWNLSQIISPSTSRTVPAEGGGSDVVEKKGLPLLVELDDLPGGDL